MKNNKFDILNKMFCLKVIIAHPSYKRPYSEVIVEHFETQNEAEKRLDEIKIQYNEDFKCDDDDINLFDMSEGELLDYIYSDSYMDQPPFDYEIFEIKIQNNDKTEN